MSLGNTGTWAVGVWAETVWAPGVWFEARPAGAGNWNLDKRRKRKGKVIRFSDFESREAYEAALKAALAPAVKGTTIVEPESPLEDEDDEILIAAISRILH